MKLVTNTGSLAARFGHLDAIDMIKNAGFDGFDISMDPASTPIFTDDYLAYAKAVKKRADERDIPCLQAHSPFARLVSEEDVARVLTLHRRSLEICHELECPIVVVHPGNDFTAEQNFERLYAPLLPLAEHYGVRMATENMWNWDKERDVSIPVACGTAADFNAHIDIAGSHYLTGCLDIGHAEMNDSETGAADMIRAMGKDRISCLHVHDNDKHYDTHTIPFAYTHKRPHHINWESIIEALREIGYNGHFTYEAGNFYRHYPGELIPSALSHMQDIGRYFIKRLTE